MKIGIAKEVCFVLLFSVAGFSLTGNEVLEQYMQSLDEMDSYYAKIKISSSGMGNYSSVKGVIYKKGTDKSRTEMESSPGFNQIVIQNGTKFSIKSPYSDKPVIKSKPPSSDTPGGAGQLAQVNKMLQGMEDGAVDILSDDGNGHYVLKGKYLKGGLLKIREIEIEIDLNKKVLERVSMINSGGLVVNKIDFTHVEINGVWTPSQMKTTVNYKEREIVNTISFTDIKINKPIAESIFAIN